MSTGMRKWMEKDCPDIPSLPAEVSIDREELRQLRDELAQYKNERDALRAKIEAMEKQEPVAWMNSRNGFICKENKNPDYNVPLKRLDLGTQTQGEGK